MKVKELILWLEKKNPEDKVFIVDIGSDSGDWIEIEDLGDKEELFPTFRIKKEEETK